MTIWLMNHYATQCIRDKGGRHYNFAKRLREMGHDVTVFCASTFHNSEDKLDTHNKLYAIYKVNHIPFVVVNVPGYKGNGITRIINMAMFFLELFPATFSYAKINGRPDVIIASSAHPFTMIAGELIAHIFKIPCICEIRDLWPEAIFTNGNLKETSLLGHILTIGEHWIYKYADALIFTKEGDTDHLKEEGWTTAQGGDIDLNKCYYINNGLDINVYNRQINTEILKDSDLKDKNKYNVIYTGTIRPMNDVGNLLDCAKLLKQENEYEDVQFLIYGEGNELEMLRNRVIDEKIDNVKLKGYVEKKYIPYILSKSSVNILNYSQSNYNWSRGNSSNKLFEYMASGKPIISTVHMGYSIINKYQCGIELDDNSPEALAEGIKYFHDLSEEEINRYGNNARQGVKNFDFSILTKKLMEVINAVCNQGNKN